LSGPGELLAGHPTAVVLVVLAQIAVTLTLVGLLARSRRGVRDAHAVVSTAAERELR